MAEMPKVIAYPDDRARLLCHGRMAVTVYSSRDPVEVARDRWQHMRQVAELMGLGLTEPVLEAEEPDWTGGRMVTLTAGVYDPDAG